MVQNKAVSVQTTNAHGGEGCECIALLVLNHGTRRRWVVSITIRPLYPKGTDSLNRRLEGSQSRSFAFLKNLLSLPGIEIVSAQPVS